jgi:NAD(P)H dehydrogenase (quinone)
MTSSGDFAVIGAAGETGLVVTAALAGRGVPVRAVLRSATSAERSIEAGAKSSVIADLADVSSLRTALADVAAVHIVPPSFDPSEEQFVANVVEVGVGLVGYHSVLQADDPQMPHHMRKNRGEIRLRLSSVPWVMLRLSIYAQTVLRLLA